MYFIGTAIPADEHILEHLQRPWRWDRAIKTGVDQSTFSWILQRVNKYLTKTQKKK